MARHRVLVLGLRSWGQLGNFLAAANVARILSEHVPGCEVEFRAGEELWPFLAGLGERIGRAARAGGAGYAEVMADADAWLPLDSEARGTGPAPVEAHALDGRHDAVVATKGIVSRLAYAALQPRGAGRSVVNFVTNHGLLELELHRSRHLALQLVPFEMSRALLVRHGIDGATVKVVGPLAASLRTPASDAGAIRSFSRVEGGDRPRVIVFSNHGGAEYAEVARVLAHHPSHPEVLFVAHKDPNLAGAVSAIAADAGAGSRWEVVEALPQAGFLAALARAARFPVCFAVSKTGPNTALEAVRTGIPMVLHRSGLPMERWVEGFVADTGCGECVETAAALAPATLAWLDDPERVRAARRRIAQAAPALSGAGTEERIAEAVRLHLEAEAVG